MLSDSNGLAVNDVLCGINECAKEAGKKEILKKRHGHWFFFREKYTKFENN